MDLENNEYIRKIFFIYDENAEEERISKTRVISLGIFILFYFIILYGMLIDPYNTDNIIIIPIFGGLLFAVPAFIIGFIISKLTNKPKNQFNPEMLSKDGVAYMDNEIKCADENQFNQTIQIYTSQGYKLKTMLDKKAILAKKSYSRGILIILILFLWPAAIIYYLAAGDDVITVTLDNDAPSAASAPSNSENNQFSAYCSKCGHGLYEDSKFCPGCGDVIGGKE